MNNHHRVPEHGVGVRGAPGERVAQVEELAVRELEGGQAVAGGISGLNLRFVP